MNIVCTSLAEGKRMNIGIYQKKVVDCNSNLVDRIAQDRVAIALDLVKLDHQVELDHLVDVTIAKIYAAKLNS